jgi:glycosyltransferase involved in cell wall biosynthesis
LLPSASVRHLGHVTDRRLLSIIYNAADVFAAPSRVENLANTVLESLACGTPVVAFDIGGMPDAIDHKINGYLAAPFDTAAFAEGIQWCLAQRDRNEIRTACRKKVLTAFSRDQETDRYISLYERLLAARST